MKTAEQVLIEVRAEHAEVTAKLGRLHAFLHGPRPLLSPHHHMLLRMQADAMTHYTNVLHQRINLLMSERTGSPE